MPNVYNESNDMPALARSRLTEMRGMLDKAMRDASVPAPDWEGPCECMEGVAEFADELREDVEDWVSDEIWGGRE